MAVRVTLEFPASAEDYDKVNEAVDSEGSPDGLIVHTAADLGGKMKVVDIWESAEQFGAFVEGRLGPKVGEVLGGDAPAPPEPQIEELHNYEVHQS
jgi:hypothetical protein